MPGSSPADADPRGAAMIGYIEDMLEQLAELAAAEGEGRLGRAIRAAAWRAMQVRRRREQPPSET